MAELKGTNAPIVDLAPQSIELIEELALPEEAKSGIYQALAEIQSDMDYQSEIFVINSGTKAAPSLDVYRSDYTNEPIGIVHADEHRVGFEICGNHQAISEALKELAEAPNDLEQAMAEKIANDPLLSDAAKGDRATAFCMMQEQMKKLKQDSKEIKIELKQNYRDDKEALKGLQTEMRNLLKQSEREGMSPELAKQIGQKANEIEEATARVIEYKKELQSTKTSLGQAISNATDSVKQEIVNTVDKIGVLMSTGIQSGLEFMHGMKSDVKLVLDKSKVAGKGIFAKLEERSEMRYRMELENQYKNEELQQKHNNFIADKLQSLHNFRETAVNRIENAGRVLQGKELKELTPSESVGKLYKHFRTAATHNGYNMNIIMSKYKTSYDKSLDRLAEIQKERQKLKMKESKGLQKAAEKAASQYKKSDCNWFGSDR
ncbi:MAG: hypothetical protein K5776_03685 [Lachnospiraceae bacterium]|nr:hypothetical protein [Lachnospiraceae bacterium]